MDESWTAHSTLTQADFDSLSELLFPNVHFGQLPGADIAKRR